MASGPMLWSWPGRLHSLALGSVCATACAAARMNGQLSCPQITSVGVSIDANVSSGRAALGRPSALASPGFEASSSSAWSNALTADDPHPNLPGDADDERAAASDRLAHGGVLE